MLRKSTRGFERMVAHKDVPSVRGSTELPFGILCSVQRCSMRLGVDIEHVISSPAGRIWVILHRLQIPVGTPCNGVDRNFSQEPDFLLIAAPVLNALNKRLQVWWITFASYL